VDESSEAVSAVYVRRIAGRSRDRAWKRGWALIERPVRAVMVVVVEVLPYHAFEVASVDDQESIEAFAAKCADETLGDRVRLRRPRRRADDPDVFALKDLVEGSREFRVDREGVARDDPGCLRAQERAPVLRCAAWGWVDSGPLEDCPTVLAATAISSRVSSPWIRR
jgi:hypothetical protein